MSTEHQSPVADKKRDDLQNPESQTGAEAGGGAMHAQLQGLGFEEQERLLSPGPPPLSGAEVEGAGAGAGELEGGHSLRVTTNLRLRKSPSLQGRVLTTMPKGSSVEAAGGSANASGILWREVRYNGLVGWASAQYLEEAAPGPKPGNQKPADVDVQAALRFYRNYPSLYPPRVAKRIQEAVGAVPDGLIGPKTVQAIANYQAAHGLEADGIAGTATLNQLFGEDIRPGKGSNDQPEDKPDEEVSTDLRRPSGLNDLIKVFGQPGTSITTAAMRAGKNGEIVNVRCHKKIAPILQAVFQSIHEAGMSNHIHTYDGCYVYRKKRSGGSSWSTHAWGISIDVNASANPMVSSASKMTISDSQKVLAPFFEKHGFYWGKHFNDPMHFQYCTGY